MTKYHVDLIAIVDGEISVKMGHDISQATKRSGFADEDPGIRACFDSVEPFVPLPN